MMTSEQVTAFQATHLSHLGKLLRIDGVLGPQTEWALDFETLSTGRRAIVRVAQVFLGLEEDPPGSNTDPAGTIRDWLGNVGAHPGDPWCAAFASHCLGTVRIASAQALGRHFPATLDPWPGDVLWYPTDATGHGHGHVEIVTGKSATETMSIGGNVANAVRCVRRPRGAPMPFGRIQYARVAVDTNGTCPGIVPTVPEAPGGTR